MALYSQTATTTPSAMKNRPKPPPLPTLPPRFLPPPNNPPRLSCSLRKASSISGGPFLSPPRRPPQGSWLFELPPGSFQAIALSKTNKAKTRLRRADLCYRCLPPAAKPQPQALLQSVLRQKLHRLPAGTTDQTIKLNARKAYGQANSPSPIRTFGLNHQRLEKLRPQPRQLLRQT